MCELPKCFRSTTRTARRPHKCCECGGIIQAGEKYEYASGIWDGPESFKTCLDCAKLRDDIDSTEPDPEFQCPLGGVAEWVHETQDAELISRFETVKRLRKEKK